MAKLALLIAATVLVVALPLASAVDHDTLCALADFECQDSVDSADCSQYMDDWYEQCKDAGSDDYDVIGCMGQFSGQMGFDCGNCICPYLETKGIHCKC